MADHLSKPAGVQSGATEQNLGKGPADMPSGGGGKPNPQSTATQVPLSRTPIPVATFGARQGTTQLSSSQAPLSRTATKLYEPVSKLKPETDL